MEKEFVTYQQSVALKELGFDEPCLCIYNKHIMHHHIFMSNINDINNQPKNSELTEISITAPLKQQVFRWFRDKYGLIGEIFSQLRPSNNFMYAFKIGGSDIIFDGFDTYEEAENASIDRLIELAKQQDNEK
jgi:hypothetical protein